jgi:redox-sensitive bicupin YhaK (pirin superfamily)
MIAGSGIVHSERTGQDVRSKPSELFGIQTWLALPQAKEEIDPDFEHTDKIDLPFIEDSRWRMRLIMGEYHGEKSPVTMLSDTLYADIHMDEGGVMDIPADTEECALYVISGEIEIGGVAYPPMQMLILRPGDQIVVKALSAVRMMVLGGAAMDGPRYMDWNFVSSSKERIQQAREDWRSGGFPSVPGDDKEFIPLPGEQ